MEGIIISFLGGNIFAGAVCWICYRMLYESRVPEMIKAEKEKRIKDLEFDNCFLQKKLSIVMSDNVRIIKERNEFANDISNKLKGL